MKTRERNRFGVGLFLALSFLVPSLCGAAAMTDYCIVPPFIGENVPANLLLLLDNSSSMYDITYSDLGNTDASGTITRQPFYCYDETYSSANTDPYAGYFDTATFYAFDFTNNYFYPIATFPAACSVRVANQLCVGINALNHVDQFVASGNYLNWLASSKFDVEKQILTGGKYVTKLCAGGGAYSDRSCNSDSDCTGKICSSSGASCTQDSDCGAGNSCVSPSCTAVAAPFLQAESRGCVGQGFIKQPLSGNFANFTGTTDPNTANKLGVTFAIRGPQDSANATAPSRGGQTYIEVYSGTYNNGNCQQAMLDWGDPNINQNTLRDDVSVCLNYNPHASNYCANYVPPLPGALAAPTSCTTDTDCSVTSAGVAGKCSNNNASCTSDAQCGTTVTPGHCSNDSSSCTSNAQCATVTTPGTCSNSGASCTADAQCGTTTNPGTCNNNNASCTADAQCGSYQHCSLHPSTSCTQNSNCTYNGCSNNVSRSCTGNSDCNVYGTCSSGTKSGQSCLAGNPDCPVAEVLGHCSVDTGITCRTASDCRYYCAGNHGLTCTDLGNNKCGNPNQGGNGDCLAQTCSGYAAATYATCTGSGTGTCGARTDSCITGTGTCVGVTTTQNTCNGLTTTQATCDGVVTTQNTCVGLISPQTYSGTCINPTQSAMVKTKVSYTHTIQTCSSYFKNGTFANGDYQRQTTECDNVLAGWGVCSATNMKVCAGDGDCAAGEGSCVYGPSSIRPGNPALVCGTTYLGQFCTWDGGTKKCSWASHSTAVDDVFAQFCNSMQPTVIDPTDSAASTTNYQTVPSLLGGIGLESQLGPPIATIPVRLKIDTTALPNGPSGLIQQFGKRIRIGAMSFDFSGSATEASATAGAAIIQPRVCSNDHTRLCQLDVDCPDGTCLSASSSASYNLDGGQVIHPVGKGYCALMTTTTCTTDANCSGTTCINGYCGTRNNTICATDAGCSGGTVCKTDGAGDHTTGLVNKVDSVRANAWTPFAEAFYNAIGYFAFTSSGTSRTDLRINTGDFNENLNPSQYRCQQNYVLLITDGSSTADQNASVRNLASAYSTLAVPGGGSAPAGWNSTCSYYNGSTYLPTLSWLAQHRNIASFASLPVYGRDRVTTYVVSTGGSNGLTGECNSTKLLTDTAANGGTTLKQANNPQALSKALQAVFEELAAKSASGTAASILSNSEGSGANILQAIFYPRKVFDNDTQAYWLGELQNFWYYVDPYIGNSSMREDTNSDSILELKQDNAVQFYFDNVSGETKVNLYQDLDGNGSGDVPVAGRQGVSPDTVKSLWRGGRQLWSRDLTVATGSPRTIYTPCNDVNGGDTNPDGGTCAANKGLMQFTYSGTASTSTGAGDNSTALQANLQYPAVAGDATATAAAKASAVKLMKYVHGFDFPGDATMRSRTVQIGSIPAATVSTDPASLYVTNPRDLGVGVWKLGDIISSTPRFQSSVRLNGYNLPNPTGYNDRSYGDDTAKTGFIYTNAYKSRGMVYAAANDGLLHAFNAGVLNVTPSGDTKARLTNSSTANLGDELWAFIPQNALPYLKYYAEPAYGHMYFLDGNVTLTDASVGTTGCTSTNYWDCPKDMSTWRTILIGGMGIGGASKDKDSGCTDDVAGTCVKTPLTGVGYSAYYALDVTDPANPKYLWEFSDAVLPDTDKGLGFATTGAAIVRISARNASNNPDNTKNGRWFAVFGSGPTGPIDKTFSRFMGTSNQPLKLYVVDMNATLPFTSTGTNPNYWVISSVLDGGTSSSATVASATPGTLNNAFAGNMTNAAIDADRWHAASSGFYQDDALYFGYTRKDDTPGTWTKGGVLKLLTFEDPNPANWKLVKVIDDIGPVTTTIGRLQDRKNGFLWLYFGTGRYFYMQDDFNTGKALYGMKEKCYMGNNTLDKNCAVKRDPADLYNQANADRTDPTLITYGWTIPLLDKITSDPNNILGGERVIANPVALTNGAVFFTTYQPNNDFCQFGGQSYMWAVQYNTGTQAPAAALVGKALVQVSTGEFKQIDLSSAFNDNHNRKMGSAMTGKPPEDPPPIVSSSNNKPVRRIIHIQEH